MKTSIAVAIGLAVMVCISLVLPASAVSIDWITVGNAGNANDSNGFGGVAYNYKIARSETTIAQYAEFLNAVAATDTYALYNSSMTYDANIAGIQRIGTDGNYSYTVIGSGNRPITFVSWFDAARFTNWLHNGQPTGAQNALTTEDGAYTLLGATSGIFNKNVGATVWIPSENEWYKAAYYDPTKNAVSGGYWMHANQSDSMTSNDPSAVGAANYYDFDYAVTQSSNYSSSQNYLTDVGAYGADSLSYYGTTDQAGNVWEWNDAVILGLQRGLRGGSWLDDFYFFGESSLRSSSRPAYGPHSENNCVGFRVASTIHAPTSDGVGFRITSISIRTGGSQIQLTWNSESSARYFIESSLDLASPTWDEAATGIISQGISTTHTFAITPGPHRFFRVAKQP